MTLRIKSMLGCFSVPFRAFLALVLVASLSFWTIPTTAQPAYANDNTESDVTIQGVDFLEPTATTWELLRVSGVTSEETLYFDISLIENGTEKSLMEHAEYSVGNSDELDELIADVITLDMATALSTDDENATPKVVFGDNPNNSYMTISVYDDATQGNPIFTGATYPVYAKYAKIDGGGVAVFSARNSHCSNRK